VVFALVGGWVYLYLDKYMLVTKEVQDLVPVILVSLGLAITVISSIACCCTLRPAPGLLLYMYAALVALVLVVESTALLSAYAYQRNLKDAFKMGLKQSLDQYGIQTDKTAAVDAMQSKLGCCGVVEHDDWQSTSWTSRHQSKLPHSCCHTTENAVCSPDIHGAQVYQTGCYMLLLTAAKHNLANIISGILLVALVHLLGITLACCLAKNSKNINYQQIS